ncbi:MAG: 4-amino-4-deoxy-L-arabinose transferase, partial [Dokdonella sp.]
RVGPKAGPWDITTIVAATFLGGYFVLGLFADAERFRVHWPLPGYLVLIVVLPTLLQRWYSRWPIMRVCSAFATSVAVIGTVLVYAYFAAASIPGGAGLLSRYKAFPEHFIGWNEAAATTRSLLAESEFRDAVLVADNFMLAAELDFALDGKRPVYSLDHSLNHKHGRAPQLRLWRRDEIGLAALAGRHVLLVVEETSGRARDRSQWLNSLCRRVAELRPRAELDLYDGGKRIAWYSGRVGGDGVSTTCRYPPVD